MIRADIHLHTSFSSDCDEEMENVIQAGIDRGLDIMCFTEHMDKDYPIEGQFILDCEAYRSRYLELCNKYREKITLLWGVELGLLPWLADWYSSYVNQYPFDFIIGSVHNPKNVDPYFPEYFEGRSEEEAYREYFTESLACLKAFSDFDAIGHMDYVVRYGPNKNKEYSYKKYSDYIDPILKIIVDKGIALEVNSAGYRKGLGEPNPCRDIVKRYKELGGEIVTIGSDAHLAEHVACDFDKAEALLLDCGFKYHAVFTGRSPKFYPLG